MEGIDEGAGDIGDEDGLDSTGIFAGEIGHEGGEEEGRRGLFSGPHGLHPHHFSAGPVDERRSEDGPIEAAVAEGLLGGVLGEVVAAEGVGACSEGGHMHKAADA